MWHISICEDLNALIATGLVDEDSPLRGMIDGRSGNYVCVNADGSESMIIISSLEGLDEIAELDYITITTPEVVFGYVEQGTDEDGNRITQDVPPDPVMRALYDSIYDQSPVPNPEDPTAPPTIPSEFFALPGGYDPSQLLNT